jgi:CRP-like cAMP-binding protein
LIQAGSEETWMGLVIHGGPIKVERDGKNVANLKKGAVFGEMAHWTSSARSATITATQHTNYLRWEPWFWAEQVKRHGLETHLEKLIQKRNS